MKVAFVHDHRFIRRGEKVFSSGGLPASVWPRYLAVFESVTVISRAGAENMEAKALASAERVDFTLLPSIASLKGLVRRRDVRARMRAALSKVDCCIIRLPSELGYLAVAEAQRLGLPFAVEVVDCPWDGMRSHGSLKGRLYAPLAFARMKMAVSAAPFVLYVTEVFLQARYPAGPGAQVVACSNVDIPSPDPAVLAAREAREASTPAGPITLGLIGSLNTRAKGIQTVLAALGEVRDNLPPISFRVLGGGDHAPWVALARKHGVDDIVCFEGTLPAGEAVLNWLDGIDVYLHPSLKEGLPRALIEAMSRGCPALGSRCAGIPELLRAEDLIAPGDAAGLARLMRDRLYDSKWRTATARSNWTRAGDYAKPVLDARRTAFWADFAAFARQ